MRAVVRTLGAALCIVALVAGALGVAEAQHGGGKRGRGQGGGGQSGRAEPAPTPEPPGLVLDGTTYPFGVPELLEAMERTDGRKLVPIYERIAAEAEGRGAKVEAFLADTALGFIAVRVGMPQRALRAATRATELYREIPATPVTNRTIPTAYSVLASAYRTAGDLPRARRVLDEGLGIARALPARRGNVGIAVLSSSLAHVALAQHDHHAALLAAREAFQVVEEAIAALRPRAPERQRTKLRRQAANALIVAGRAQVAGRDFDEADATFARARAYVRSAGVVEIEAEAVGASANLAQVRGDHARAAREYEEAIALARRVNRVAMLTSYLHGAARSYLALGRADQALPPAREAIALIEDVRSELSDTGLRSGFLDDKQAIYQLALRLALRLNRLDEAFTFTESARARAFLDLLGSHATLSKGATRALADEEVRLRARLAEARARAEQSGEDDEPERAQEVADAAERDYRAFLDRVRKASAEQASLMTVQPATLAEVQKLLPEGTTLLEYVVGEHDVVVWIVDRQRAKTTKLAVTRADLATEVREFRDAIARVASLDQVQDRATDLYARLFENLRAEIRGTRLLIVPHEALHYLPFAALRTPEGKWLVEDYAIATLPSASVLKFLNVKGHDAGNTGLAIGNPDLGPALALRWAEREARLVGRRVPATTVLVQREATEARAKQFLETSGLVHFATHGELNEADPLASALLLAPGGADDGRLEVREVFGLDIHARLVVLSACETGLGKLSRGDELVGLQRAFLYAGTPAVVTTLWKIDDRASYELIEAFYGGLGDGTATALRRAQIAAMQKWKHPFAWAAFVLTGMPR